MVLRRRFKVVLLPLLYYTFFLYYFGLVTAAMQCKRVSAVHGMSVTCDSVIYIICMHAVLPVTTKKR